MIIVGLYNVVTETETPAIQPARWGLENEQSNSSYVQPLKHDTKGED
jgi:hypothetical protein